MAMLLLVKDCGFFQEKKNAIELSTGKILVHSAFHQTLGDECTFQQDSLKHKAKSTLKTVTVPEWPGYSLDLNLLEKSMARSEKGCIHS